MQTEHIAVYNWEKKRAFMRNKLRTSSYIAEKCTLTVTDTVADPGFEFRGEHDFVNGGGGYKIIESVEGWCKSHF